MRYGGVAIMLHWVVAVGVASQFALGWWMIGLPDEGRIQAYWFNLHKSIGISLAALVGAWLAWRARHPKPVFVHVMPPWQQRLARATHFGLYACLLTLVVSGYLGSSFSGYPVRYFGWALPNWGWKWPVAKEALSTLHLGATWLLAALSLLHIAGALWHAMKRDGVIKRMWPSWRPG
jgi:cytochrome b561